MNNIEAQVKEVNSKFARLIRSLGHDNTKGSERHRFEVDFAYALHEITMAPIYMQQKFVDRANLIVADLIKQIKTNTPAAVV